MIEKVEISVDVIIHATEDIKKFFDAFEEMFGLKQEKFSINNFVGHFDNSITMLNAKITKNNAFKMIQELMSRMDKIDIEDITTNMENMIEDSTMHLRIDKQKFVQNEIMLREDEAIKIKIHTPIYRKKDTVKIFSELLKISN